MMLNFSMVRGVGRGWEVGKVQREEARGRRGTVEQYRNKILLFWPTAVRSYNQAVTVLYRSGDAVHGTPEIWQRVFIFFLLQTDGGEKKKK